NHDQTAQAKHAHGNNHQTLADLGLIGLVVSLAALAAWLLAVSRALGLRAPRETVWTPERQGLVALALVAVVFGVHSAIDWTWFVPALAVTGLFCAGWVAGRGPARAPAGGEAAAGHRARMLAAVSPELPAGRARRFAFAAAAVVVAFGLLAAVALPILRAALYLDPLSSQSQADYVAALRAQQAQQAQQAAAAAQRRARAKSVRRKRGSPPAAANTTSP